MLATCRTKSSSQTALAIYVTGTINCEKLSSIATTVDEVVLYPLDVSVK